MLSELTLRVTIGSISQETALSWVVRFLLLLFLLANGTLAILAVLFPRRAVQIHARFSRFFWEATIGPRWEEFLERQNRKEDLEYLRKGPYEPQAFPFLIRAFRLIFILYTIVDLLLLGVWCYFFVASFMRP